MRLNINPKRIVNVKWLLKNHRRLIVGLGVLAVIIFTWSAIHRSASAPTAPPIKTVKVSTPAPAPAVSPALTPAPDNKKPPASDVVTAQDQAASVSVVVNKGRVLPSGYVPANLVVPSISLRTNSGSSEMHVRADTATAMEKLFAGASQDGLQLMLASGYRSYTLQNTLYNGYVASSGQAYADKSSARPGHSEHQTGLAADLEPAGRNCEVLDCFADTPEGKWLAANAYKYGFIIRYQAGKESLTGYEYEPWHVRYLGVDLATKVYQSGKTLEQYFGLPSYATYPATSYQLR